MKVMEFELNEFLVTLLSEGAVQVVTNNKESQSTCKKLKDYVRVRHYNKVSLLIEEEEVARQVLSTFSYLADEKIRSAFELINGIEERIVEVIRDKGCCTLFTTHGNLQYDQNGRDYADRNNYEIIKVNKINILH